MGGETQVRGGGEIQDGGETQARGGESEISRYPSLYMNP